jgi:hypothetical protein
MFSELNALVTTPSVAIHQSFLDFIDRSEEKVMFFCTNANIMENTSSKKK